MKILLFATLFSFSMNFFGQSDHYFITVGGETVYMYDNPDMDGTWEETNMMYQHNISFNYDDFYYFDKDGNKIKVAMTDIKELHAMGRYFEPRNLKGKKGPKRLQEIIIVTSKYTITQNWVGEHYTLYIWDADGNYVDGKVVVSSKLENDTKTYTTLVKPKIKDCPELMEKIEANLKSSHYNKKGWGENYRNNMFYGIYNVTCE